MVIAEVDCTKYRSLCKDNQIKALPTIKSFTVGSEPAQYSGERTMSNLDAYVQRHLLVSKQSKAESLGGGGDGSTVATTLEETAAQQETGE